jgi:hypothetical protein
VPGAGDRFDPGKQRLELGEMAGVAADRVVGVNTVPPGMSLQACSDILAKATPARCDLGPLGPEDPVLEGHRAVAVVHRSS